MSGPGLNPVCGCDNVTYWNASVSASFGESVRADGPCPHEKAVVCDGNANPCEGGRRCNLGAESFSWCANIANEGTCWGLPKTCPAGAPDVARACLGGAQCKSLCESILAEKKFYLSDSCK